MSVSKREENKMANPKDTKKQPSEYEKNVAASKKRYEEGVAASQKRQEESKRKYEEGVAASKKRYDEIVSASKKRYEEAIAASKARMSPAPKPVAASPNQKPTFGANVTVSTKTKPQTPSVKSEPATKPMVPSDYKTYKSSSKEASDFRSNFAKARKSGAKEFTWEGRKYTTKLKGE